MAILKKDIQSLQKEIKALEKKMEKLIAAAAKSEKPKVAKKTTAKSVKAKTTKKVPTKNAPVKKKAAMPTATDEVLKIINRSKNGVDAATLVKKTGFNAKKIQNILFRTHKQGKIKRAGKGVYLGA
jgi:predicted Rossmann fold nucleotide-binding protein DprA/Smf involved in DNA uptake